MSVNENFLINYQHDNKLQIYGASNTKINHRQHKKVVLCSIIMFALWMMLKLLISIAALEALRQWDLVHFIGLSIYILGTDTAAAIFIFHYVFILESFFVRFEKFHAAEMRVGENWNNGNGIKALEAYSSRFNLFASLIDIINLIFRLQVIEQL